MVTTLFYNGIYNEVSFTRVARLWILIYLIEIYFSYKNNISINRLSIVLLNLSNKIHLVSLLWLSKDVLHWIIYVSEQNTQDDMKLIYVILTIIYTLDNKYCLSQKYLSITTMYVNDQVMKRHSNCLYDINFSLLYTVVWLIHIHFQTYKARSFTSWYLENFMI